MKRGREKHPAEIGEQLRAIACLLAAVLAENGVGQGKLITILTNAGLPGHEIARILGTSINTVMVTRSRQRKPPKKKAKNQSDASTPDAAEPAPQEATA